MQLLTVGEPVGGFRNGYFLIISQATRVYSTLVGYFFNVNIDDATDERNDLFASMDIFPVLRPSSTSGL